MPRLPRVSRLGVSSRDLVPYDEYVIHMGTYVALLSLRCGDIPILV